LLLTRFDEAIKYEHKGIKSKKETKEYELNNEMTKLHCWNTRYDRSEPSEVEVNIDG
jgi:hypothetical protein